MPGYLYTDKTVFFARLGYANTRFKISSSDASLVNVSKNLDGFRYGLGVKHFFTQHWSARVEVDQIAYRQTAFTGIDGTATKTTEITPRATQAEIDLIYEFV